MANSVSNDALWGKLSEISEQLNRSKQTEDTPHFSGVKDEIISIIRNEADILGKHNDINFGASNQNWQATDENVTKILRIVSRIRKQQKEFLETQVKSNQEYFNFKLFKIRKTSFVIALLGLLVFLLTLLCMKQQNDYSLLNNEYYKQSIVIKKMQKEHETPTKNTTSKPIFLI